MMPPPLVMPLRLVIHKNLVLGAFPLVRARDSVVLIELHRLVLRVWIVPEVKVLPLEFPTPAAASSVCLGRELALVEFCTGRVSRNVCLRLSGYWLLPFLGFFTRRIVITYGGRLLEVLRVRTATGTGLKFLAGLLRRHLLRRCITTAAAFFLSVIVILILVLSRTCKQRQPHTAR